MTTNTNSLATDAAAAIRGAQFRDAWPIEVRKTLVRAAQTEGEFPPFAVRDTRWALREARNVESKMLRDIIQGEAVLSQTDKRRLKVAK